MRKFIALLLALVMLLLAACGTAQPPVDEQTPSTEVTEPSGTEAVQGDPTQDATQPSADAPTSEPTTEPATEPTSEPTTEPTTEPTDPTVNNSGTGGTEETVEPTNPSATEPPATETPATEPPATEPPATNPPVTDPPATEPPATEPPATGTPGEVSIKLNKRLLDLDEGATYTLKATTTGSGTLSWSSSDTSVATVDQNGKVTAKAVGTAVITATFGGKTAQCVVDVYEPAPTEPEIGPAVLVWKSSNSGSWAFGRVGNYLSFHAAGRTAEGEGGENMQVTASSSNTGAATVSVKSNGNTSIVTVSFVGTGSATITLTSVDGNASTSFTIEVNNYSSMGVSTPQDYVNAVNSVVQQNGCSVITSGAYTVLTLSDAQLSWSSALGQGQNLARRAFYCGGECAGCSYQGIDPETGEHIFYLHSY